MFVCLCKSVTDRQIKNAIDSGISSFEGMQNELNVATVCGACTCEVKRIMMKKFNCNLSANQSVPSHNRLAQNGN